MFDANEERLLTDLLHEIGEADRRGEPPSDLEGRMMARWDARASQANSPRNYWRIGAVAAAVATIISGIALSERIRLAAGNDQRSPVESQPVASVTDGASRNARVISENRDPARDARRERRPRSAAHVRRGPAEKTHVVEFVPLAPMTADDLSRSLQIVPIRIGDTPADLLLGEDGTAKAIRVSSDAHVFWRPR